MAEPMMWQPVVPYGPIRPDDATDGWLVEGDNLKWSLSKYDGRAKIRATNANGCAWTIYADDQKTVLREKSAASVWDAQREADAWMSGQTRKPL
jgi:hypothetical protein